MTDLDHIAALAERMPELAGVVPERMGGLTNRVYRLGDQVLRLPGKGTEDYIDREAEAVSARAEIGRAHV